MTPYQKTVQWLKSWRTSRPTIYHVSDNTDWVLRWVAYYISQEVAQRGATSQILEDPWRLRHQMIHFHNRYTYLQKHPPLHSSNRLFLTWLHGHPHDAEFAAMGEALMKQLPTLEKIVTSCRITEKQLLEAGVPAHKLVLIPLGLDTQTFVPPPPGAHDKARQSLGIPEGAFCIGSFQKDGSGWGEGYEPKLIKGPDILLETLGHLAQRHRNLFVLLTGPSRGYVKQGLERLGIPYLHHHLKHYPDILSYYYALDAYLIPSRAEGGPIGLMESWAAGVPVVSTRMGMPADWVRHDDNGLLAEVEDTQGLAHQLERLIEDASLRQHVIEQGHKDVQALDWRLLAGHYYERLYQPFLS